MAVLKLPPTVEGLHADWRVRLPVLSGSRVTLRELRRSDAPSLYAVLQHPEVARHTWPAPSSVTGFERFIKWAATERAKGRYICYGIVPRGGRAAIGVFELRALQPRFFRGELGFVLDPGAWGTGVYLEGARLLLDFAFRVVNVHRIEARAAVTNPRGNAALRKIGAQHEGVLHAAFVSGGRYIDQNLWALVADPTQTLEDALAARHDRL